MGILRFELSVLADPENKYRQFENPYIIIRNFLLKLSVFRVFEMPKPNLSWFQIGINFFLLKTVPNYNCNVRKIKNTETRQAYHILRILIS